MPGQPVRDEQGSWRSCLPPRTVHLHGVHRACKTGGKTGTGDGGRQWRKAEHMQNAKSQTGAVSPEQASGPRDAAPAPPELSEALSSNQINTHLHLDPGELQGGDEEQGQGRRRLWLPGTQTRPPTALPSHLLTSRDLRSHGQQQV